MDWGWVSPGRAVAQSICPVSYTHLDVYKRQLLRDRIIQAYNHYTEKGYCPIYSRENIEKMYTEYNHLGGNGTVTELVDRIRELPTERKEEENG